jgi:hypothetical protein
MKKALLIAIGIWIVLVFISNTSFFIQNEKILVTMMDRADILLHVILIISSVLGFIVVAHMAYLWLRKIYIDNYNKNIRLNIDRPEVKPHTRVTRHPQGGFVGYRYFKINEQGQLCSLYPDKNGRHEVYEDGYLQSHHIPTINNEAGIYAAKTKNSPVLENYSGTGDIFAKVWLFGRVVPMDFVYRASECQITDVYLPDEKQWISYREWEAYVENWQS